MLLTLVADDPTSIPVNDMHDGEIAVITQWNCYTKAVGWVVQRFQNYLVPLGVDSGQSWSNSTFWRGRTDLRVRILPPDTLLKVA